MGGVSFYEVNRNVNDRRMIILEDLKRTKVVSLIPRQNRLMTKYLLILFLGRKPAG
jgi:hypothetical protein